MCVLALEEQILALDPMLTLQRTQSLSNEVLPMNFASIMSRQLGGHRHLSRTDNASAVPLRQEGTSVRHVWIASPSRRRTGVKCTKPAENRADYERCGAFFLPVI